MKISYLLERGKVGLFDIWIDLLLKILRSNIINSCTPVQSEHTLFMLQCSSRNAVGYRDTTCNVKCSMIPLDAFKRQNPAIREKHDPPHQKGGLCTGKWASISQIYSIQRPPLRNVLIPSLYLGMSRIRPLKSHRSAKFSYAHRKIGISNSSIKIALDGSGKSVKIKCFQDIKRNQKYIKTCIRFCPQFYLGIFREISHEQEQSFSRKLARQVPWCISRQPNHWATIIHTFCNKSVHRRKGTTPMIFI